jgi:hypothetical protein
VPPRFRIRRSPDQRPFAGFPGLFAGCRVLRRLSMPRHPPCTLPNLATAPGRRPSPKRGHGRARRNQLSPDAPHAGYFGRGPLLSIRRKGARRPPPDGKHSVGSPPDGNDGGLPKPAGSRAMQGRRSFGGQRPSRARLRHAASAAYRTRTARALALPLNLTHSLVKELLFTRSGFRLCS